MPLDLTENSGLVDLKRGVLWGIWQYLAAMAAGTGGVPTTPQADAEHTIFDAIDLGSALTTVDLDLSTLAPNRLALVLQFVADVDNHVGTITLSGSLDGVTFDTFPLVNEVTGAVTDGTIAVTAGAWNETVRLRDWAIKHLRVSYAKTSGAGRLSCYLQAR